MQNLTRLSDRYATSCRQVIVAAATGGCLAFAAMTSAVAAPEGTLDGMSLELGPDGIFVGVTVQSSNGASWTNLKDTNVALAGSIEIEMKPGLIKAFGIYLGTCSGHACFEQVGTPLLGSIHVDPPYVKHIDGTTSFSFSSLKLGDPGSPGIPVVSVGSEIVARCNAGLQDGKSIQQGFGFVHTVKMTLGADTRMWNQFQFGTAGNNFVLGNKSLDDVDFSKTVDVAIPVTCEGLPPGAGAPDQVGVQLPDYQVIGATLHGDPAVHAGACPVGIKLFMSATSNIKGPFEARVEAKSGWKSKKYVSQTSESGPSGTWSRHFQDTLMVPIVMPVNQSSGGGAINAADGIGNLGTAPKPEDPIVPPGQPSGPGQVQTGFNPGNLHEDSLRLVVTGGGTTVASDWWKYKVTCDPKTNPEVGGLPGGLGQPVFIKQAFLTLFPVAPKDGSKCGITVSGLVQTSVKNVDVTFRLKNHQGNTTNAQTINTSHANNIGKFVEYLDFSTSGQGIWVSQGGGWTMPAAGAGSQAGRKQGSFQAVVENPAQFASNVASYDFTCYDPAPVGLQQPPTVTVNPDVSRPGALVGPKPVVDPVPVDRKIAKPEPIVCQGGRVRNGACVCSGQTVVIGGLMSSGKARVYRCVAKTTTPKVVKPKRVVDPKPVVTRPRIACAGGVARSSRCVCPRGTSLKNGRCTASAAPVRSSGSSKPPIRSRSSQTRVPIR